MNVKKHVWGSIKKQGISCLLTFAFISLAISLTGCKPPDNTDVVRAVNPNSKSEARPDVSLQITLPTPNNDNVFTVGPQIVQVILSGDEKLIQDANIKITGDMTHAGMVPVIAEARAVGHGIYETNDFVFDMSGDWFLTTEVVLQNGETLTDVMSFTVFD